MKWPAPILRVALVCLLSGGAGWALAQQDPRMAPGPPHEPNLVVGQEAPDFELRSLEGEAFRLSEQRGQRPILLLFFRGTW